jgi:hypothetical protein
VTTGLGERARDVLTEVREVEGLHLHEPGDVAARREVLAVAADDDDPDLVVGVDLREPLGHLGPGLHRDDVEPAVVDGQVGDAAVVAALESDLSAGQGHGVSSLVVGGRVLGWRVVRACRAGGRG